MQKTETRQERRAREREHSKAGVANSCHDDVSTSRQKRPIMPLILSGVAGMILALAGSRLLSPVGTKCSETRKDAAQQGQPVPPRMISGVSGRTYSDFLAIDAKDVEGMDIAELNLICGSGLPGTEGTDVRKSLNRLDEMTELVKSDIGNPANLTRWKANRPPGETSESIYKMRILVAVLQQKCGIHYNEELAALTTANNGKPAPSSDGKPGTYKEWDYKFYSNASNVFLHGLLSDEKQGTCVSMPVLYTAVARRLGYPVFLVMAKGHLFCRWDSAGERFNIEGTGVGGMTPRPDEFYHTFPSRLSETELKFANYLKSLTPAEELALFLETRAVSLSTHQRHDERLVALAQAVHLAKERGLPDLERKIAVSEFLPYGTRRAIEQPLLDGMKTVPDPPPGAPQR